MCLSQVSGKLEEQSRRWVARLPDGSPSKSLNFALIRFLCSRLEYPYKSLPDDLTQRIPAVGPVPDSGFFRKRPRQASTTLPIWTGCLRARNLQMIERARKSAGAEEARLCCEKTLREVEKGWATQPSPITETVLCAATLPHRFAINEQHSGRDREIRVIDDFRASEVNGLFSTVGTAAPKTWTRFSAWP